MMDQSTSHKAGPFDVRTVLLSIIGSRKEGVSHQELMRKMNELMGWKAPLCYEPTLVTLVEECQVSISHCGMANHKTRIYSLCVQDQYKKTCRVCQLTKSAMTFRKRPDSIDGYLSMCKLCENRQRKEKGWANKSRRSRQRELMKDEGSTNNPSNQPRVILSQEELDAATAAVKAESLEDYQRKWVGRVRYVVVNGKVLPASHELSPVEEYDRARRRLGLSK